MDYERVGGGGSNYNAGQPAGVDPGFWKRGINAGRHLLASNLHRRSLPAPALCKIASKSDEVA